MLLQQLITTQEQVILASVITAIITVLLATVTFMLVQIAVCKCIPYTPGGAETGTSAGEGQVYDHEQVDGGEGGVVILPTWRLEQEERVYKTLYQLQFHFLIYA